MTRLLVLFAIVLSAVGFNAVPAFAVNKTDGGITVDVSLPAAQRAVTYSHQIAPSAPVGSTFTFVITSGSLPMGLSMTSSGLITGSVDCSVPNGNNSLDMTITASTGEVGNFTGSKNFSINVTANPANACALTLGTITTTGNTAANYSSTISTSGGTAPYTYSLVGGSLPGGLSLSSGGTISGLPTTAGTYTFTVKATDSAGTPLSGNKTYSITITQATLTLSPTSLPIGTTGTSYSQTITATGGIGANTFAVTAGSLPTGLTLSSGGVLSGTPTVAGTYNFTITGTDSNSNTGSRAYSVTVYTPITVSPASLPNGTTGTSYSQTITASGGSGTYTNFAVSAGSLPTGLSLSPTTGAITGTPSAAGVYNFTVQVTDSASNTGSRAYTVTIYTPITVSPASLPNGTTGTSYSQTITASGGSGTYSTFAVSSGSLPTGLSIDSGTGAITGTPTVAGTYNFTVQVTDNASNTGSRAYTVVIYTPITVSPSSLPNGTTGTSYSQTITASGGSGTYSTYAVSSGSLPTGLSINPGSGAITGTPSAAGTYNFTIQVTDNASNTGSRAYTVTVYDPIAVAPASLPGGTNGSSYSQTITASGGSGSYTSFAVSAGALPSGLTLSSGSGDITGTATAAGTYNFTIQVTDSVGNTGSRAYSVTIAPGAVLTVNPATLPNGTTGSSYSQSITATGGTSSYTNFAVISGSLPTGLSLAAGTGAITGTPTVAGTYNFTVEVTDSAGNTGTRAYSVTVYTPIAVSPASLPNGTTGTSYGTQTITASGGTGIYTNYAVSAGSLPTGLGLNASSGDITGTPSAAGTYNFTIQVTDSASNTGSRAYAVTIYDPISVTPASLPGGTNGTSYSQTISATGGSGSYTSFAVTAGSLPAGLTLHPTTGAITGTPTTVGSYNFTITVTDSVGNTGSQAYSVSIAPGAVLTVNPATLPDGTNGTSYGTQTITATGGTGTYTNFAVSAGSLPTGLNLNAGTGEITGTPTAAGTFNFTVQVTDSDGNTGTRAYSVTIAPGAVLTVNPATLPNGTNGTSYGTQTITATGGTGTYTTFAVSAGSLPTGLSLNAGNGDITGTPSAAGTFNFTVQVTDNAGNTGTRAYSVTIAPGAVLTVTPATLPNGTNGTSYGTQTVSATGGTGTYTSFAVTAGSLPTGLNLNAGNGDLTGTPTAAGTFNFTIEVTDNDGNTGTRAYAVTIAALAITVNPATLPNGTNGTSYGTQTVTATGGTGTYTNFAVSAGSLPTGLNLNAGNGDITGTPTAAGTFNFTIQVTDSAAATGTRAYTVTIAPGAVLTVNPATLPNGTNGTSYGTQTITATGGTGTYTNFAVSAGSLPTGLSLNAGNGDITGTPTAAGTFNFTVQVTDDAGNTGTRAYAVTIAAGAVLTVNPATLPNGTNGTSYGTQTITATGGTGTYTTFAVTAGSLPTGLSLNAGNGDVTGTPTAAGAFNFTIQVTDDAGNTGTRAYSVTIAAGAVLTVNPATLPNGTNGTSYGTQTISATGGTGTYTNFAVSAGSLPTGLSLNAGNGDITGTPTAAGTFNFTVQVTDDAGNTGTRAYAVTIAAGAVLTVNPATLPNGTNGTLYGTQTITATGGTGTYTNFAVSAGSLPTGLSLNAGNGDVTGTPTAAGAFNFTIQVTDDAGNTGTRAYSVTIAPGAVLTVNPTTLPNGTVGTSYGTQTVSASGGTGSYTDYSVTSGALPTGLSLNNASGDITGTPTASGPFNFTITATDNAGNTGSRTYAVTIAALSAITVNPATLPNGTNGTSYGTQTITATGGTGTYTNFAVTVGSLPTGLSLNAGSGDITGTPTAAGTFNFTVQVTDSGSNTGTRAYTVTIAPGAVLTVNPATLPNGTNGTSYGTQTITATGGTGTYTNFAVTAGSLPTGLNLNAGNGDVTGTPTAAGTFNFTVQVTDDAGNTGTRAYAVTIAAGAVLSVGPASLPNGTNGTLYPTQTITATGGTGSYTNFAVTVGSLPPGLGLNPTTGDITGTPTSAGTFTFTVQVTDSAGNTGTLAYSVTIAAGAVLTVNPVTLPNGTNGTSYGTQTITATGGTGTYTTYAVTAGSLPTGLNLNAGNGDITGTPTAAGAFNFTIQVTDDAGNTGTRAYSVTIAGGAVLTVNPATLPNGTNGTPYGTQTISATGGTGTYTNFAVTAGSLPTGLGLNAGNGDITGTPTATGPFSFTVTVTDNAGNTGARAYSVSIAAAVVVMTLGPATLPDPTNGTAYSQTVTASGGTGPYTYAVTAGTLPTGLTLNPNTGEISGTPTAAGAFSFTITATDSLSNTALQAYSVTTQPGATVVIDIGGLPDAQEAVPYSADLGVYGSTGPYTYSISAGALPPGLSINPSTGWVSGTPTVTGAFTFTLYVEDSFGNWGSKVFTMNVVARPNPALDPEVSGLVGAEFDVAGQFGENQLETVSRHLESLRGDDCGTAPESEKNDDAEEKPNAAQCERGLSFWGAVTAEEGRDGSYDAGAVTGGVDWRMSNDFALGLAVSAAYGSEDVGSNGSGLDALGESATGYFLYNPLGGLYLEGALGWGVLDMGVDRYVTQSGGVASLDREAAVVFGSLGLDYELQLGAMRLSPYARYEFVDIDLDGASESGASSDNLTYLRADRRIQSVVTGARVSMNFDSDWGQIAPYLRLEHRARSLGGYEQLIAYSDDLATLYALSEGETSDSVWAAALGARADLEVGQLGFELGSSGTDAGIFRDFVFRVEFRAAR